MINSLIKAATDLAKLKRNPVSYAREQGVIVGDGCRFLGTTRGTFGSEPFLVTIGNHVTITSGVQFVTHDGGVWVLREEHPDIDLFGPITIGNNVFIGLNSILLPNIEIGSNSIVGAGSLVNKSIPPDSIWAGVPARPISNIEDYTAKALANAMFVRSLPEAQRRRILIERFRTPNAPVQR